MKKSLLALVLALSLLIRVPWAKADLFGGDLPLLAQIVVNTMETITQLSEIVGATKEALELQREVQEGIHLALSKIDTINRLAREETWNSIESPLEALRLLRDIFGLLPDGPERKTLRHVELVAAESVQVARDVQLYGDSLNRASSSIQSQAINASPMRAQQLTAQASGALLAANAQSQKNDAQKLKLMATLVSMKNREEKINAHARMQQFKELSEVFSRPSMKLRPAIEGAR